MLLDQYIYLDHFKLSLLTRLKSWLSLKSNEKLLMEIILLKGFCFQMFDHNCCCIIIVGDYNSRFVANVKPTCFDTKRMMKVFN
jgi:hypothetical protein